MQNNRTSDIDENLEIQMFRQIRAFEAKHAVLQDLDDKRIVGVLTQFIEKKVNKQVGSGK